MEDRFHRALWHARFAIDALFRMNHQNGFALVKTLHRTHNNAVCVLTVETWFSDDVSHFYTFPKNYQIHRRRLDVPWWCELLVKTRVVTENDEWERISADVNGASRT